jgi:hypothetical protein
MNKISNWYRCLCSSGENQNKWNIPRKEISWKSKENEQMQQGEDKKKLS